MEFAQVFIVIMLQLFYRLNKIADDHITITNIIDANIIIYVSGCRVNEIVEGKTLLSFGDGTTKGVHCNNNMVCQPTGQCTGINCYHDAIHI